MCRAYFLLLSLVLAFFSGCYGETVFSCGFNTNPFTDTDFFCGITPSVATDTVLWSLHFDQGVDGYAITLAQSEPVDADFAEFQLPAVSGGTDYCMTFMWKSPSPNCGVLEILEETGGESVVVETIDEQSDDYIQRSFSFSDTVDNVAVRSYVREDGTQVCNVIDDIAIEDMVCEVVTTVGGGMTTAAASMTTDGSTACSSNLLAVILALFAGTAAASLSY